MFPRLRGEETMFPQQCFRNNVSTFAGALTLICVQMYINFCKTALIHVDCSSFKSDSFSLCSIACLFSFFF